MTTETIPADKKTGVFIGSKGLRAGWGILLFLTVLIGLSTAIVFAVKALHLAPSGKEGSGGMDPMNAIIGEGAMAAVVLAATVITALIERRRLGQLGLSLKGFLPRLLQGVLAGLIMLSLQIGVLWACKAIAFDGIALKGAEIWTYAGLWGAAFLLVGLFEELAFRTYLQQTLARGINFRIAAIVTGVMFAAIHISNPGETPIGLAQVLAAGLVLSFAVWRTGTIWWAVGFHAAWDWTQSYLYGVADSGLTVKGHLLNSHPMGPEWLSGGSVGPEGSLLTFGAMALTAVVIAVTLKRQDEKLDMKW